MRRNLFVIIPFIFFLIISFFLWKGLREDPSKISSPLIGKPVPTFVGHTLLKPSQEVNQNIFKGNITLLNVWASWCVSCQVEHATLIDIARSNQLTLIGLDYKDEQTAAEAWLKRGGNPYSQIIFDPQGKIALNLGVYGTPETFLIDSKGIIRYKYIGPITSEVWQQDVLPQVERLRRK